MLWMDKNMPDAFEQSVMNEAVIESGNMIGDLAMGYFGEFSEVPFTKNTAGMLAETKRLLDAGVRTIAEAAFAYENHFCMVDILRANDGGSFDIIEVKGSSGTADEEDSFEDKKFAAKYLHDMAYQYYVVTNAGYRVNKVFLMQLNKNYVRYGALDISELFVLNEATDKVLALQEDIPINIDGILSIAEQTEEPEDFLGTRCNSPYLCGYKQHCWREMPENNIYDIGFKMLKSKKDDYFQSGIVTFEDVVQAEIHLSDSQYRQVNTMLHDLPTYVNKEGIREFLDSISYPIYFLDFETFMPAIPPWDGTHPYMQLPFQYSLHIQEKRGAPLVHKEFLAKEGVDQRRELAERLCEDIPKGACSLAYNSSFETRILNELASCFPDLAEHLMDIHDGMKDLIIPFRRGHYYTKEMCGSASLKYVLPAMFPDDPELSYSSLSIVHDGGAAMTIFPTLHEKPPKEIEEIREALLAYCKLDTFAMVKILEKLYGLST